MSTPSALATRLERATQSALSGQTLQSELLFIEILRDHPEQPQALSGLAQLAMRRGDTQRSIELLRRAVCEQPGVDQFSLSLAAALAESGEIGEAIGVLDALLARQPDAFMAWLLLGNLHEVAGHEQSALLSWFEAVTRAQRAGRWRAEDGSQGQLSRHILHAISKVREGGRQILFASYETLRHQYGSLALTRVDAALRAYLAEEENSPPDPRQRPKFLYIPGLPSQAYYDPFLHSWALRLQDGFPQIREEALRVWEEDRLFKPFLDLPAHVCKDDYLRGVEGLADGQAPSWEAFFFYRHGKPFEPNHLRCPKTSALLESLELCRIADQAPEICFSVLRPGTHITPHYGVTNARLVMHLPLVVPADCALNVLGVGEHCWQEGRLMMFDDTFQHEAWNRSEKTRIILLIDCWNPYLTAVERIAIKSLVEAINGFQLSAPTSVVRA